MEAHVQERLTKQQAASVRRLVLGTPQWSTQRENDAKMASWQMEIATEAVTKLANEALWHIHDQLEASIKGCGWTELWPQLPSHLQWIDDIRAAAADRSSEQLLEEQADDNGTASVSAISMNWSTPGGDAEGSVHDGLSPLAACDRYHTLAWLAFLLTEFDGKESRRARAHASITRHRTAEDWWSTSVPTLYYVKDKIDPNTGLPMPRPPLPPGIRTVPGLLDTSTCYGVSGYSFDYMEKVISSVVQQLSREVQRGASSGEPRQRISIRLCFHQHTQAAQDSSGLEFVSTCIDG
ncbi:hypothetical protein PINS_up010120 [Pythium insidiosum]|nr:hypothetical protein PINS_up010120 [Pythium insidiosum]